MAAKSDAVIGAITPWFGAKRRLAPRVVEAIGRHSSYWEPFCGSLAVLLAKPACVMETANDLHGDLINLARVLSDADASLELYGRLSRLLLHEGLFQEAAGRLRPFADMAAPVAMDVGRAADFMVISWYGRNGVGGTRPYNMNFCVRYTSNGGHAATRWASAVSSIPEWHRRLRNVTILNRDAFDVLGRIEDKAGTAVYCDPPYLAKGAKYIHDFRPDDHARLAESLSRFRSTRVVVSYYDPPRLADLYPPDRWSRAEIEVTRSMANQGGKLGADKATEVLLVNESSAGLLFKPEGRA